VNTVLLAAFLIGFVAGLRSMTAPAVTSWAAFLGILTLQQSELRFMALPIAVGGLSLFAVGELVADKLPFVPRRTAIAPLLARITTGALSVACLALHHSLGLGIAAGAVGAVIGAFTGYYSRRHLVMQLKIRDLYVALCEDAVAIALAVCAVRLAA
jgi:uncharacterized membrane protein